MTNPYRMPSTPSPLVLEPKPKKPCSECHVGNIRRGSWELVKGTYGNPDARYAYVCHTCGDTWR